jgi:hypothetical protein
VSSPDDLATNSVQLARVNVRPLIGMTLHAWRHVRRLSPSRSRLRGVNSPDLPRQPGDQEGSWRHSRPGVARCRIVEQHTSEHNLSAVPDGDGILVSCTCGWEDWSRRAPSLATLQWAEAQIGGRHLADIDGPTPPRREVLFAVGAFALMVLVTAVAVYLIFTW